VVSSFSFKVTNGKGEKDFLESPNGEGVCFLRSGVIRGEEGLFFEALRDENSSFNGSTNVISFLCSVNSRGEYFLVSTGGRGELFFESVNKNTFS
jgi:hypothetical protein